MENHTIYDNSFDFCRPYLVDGEYIIWKGKPGEKNILNISDILIIPFSLFWCGFAVFWEISVISSGAPLPFALFGVPFLLVGSYLVFGRFIHTVYKRKRTAYVITNKKIIRIRGKKVDMLDGKNMPPMYIDIHKDGKGTIWFNSGYNYPNSFNKMNINNFNNSHIFFLDNIPDVANVGQIINNIEK